MVVLGTVEAALTLSCFVAVLGSTMLGSVGLRIALGIRATIVSATTVFGSCLRSGLCSPLYSYSFTLCPSFSFPFLIPPPLAEKIFFRSRGIYLTRSHKLGKCQDSQYPRLLKEVGDLKINICI